MHHLEVHHLIVRLLLIEFGAVVRSQMVAISDLVYLIESLFISRNCSSLTCYINVVSFNFLFNFGYFVNHSSGLIITWNSYRVTYAQST